MVRTKADRVPTKAVGSKAPAKLSGRKNIVSRRAYVGGNPYHPRATPNWQKPITFFIDKSLTSEIANDIVSSSKEKQIQDVEESTEKKDEDID